jgi:hypothetical protein
MGIPHPEHPVWRRLVNEEVPFRPSFLGARMFLANARADRRRPDGGGRTGVQVERLRDLYAQNQECRSARQDLAALRMSEIFMADSDCGGWFKRERSDRSVDLPSPDHPGWHCLVIGDVPFQPSFLGARVYLAHARAKLRQPGGGSRMAAHAGQLRALYARNAECGSVQLDLARMVMTTAARRRPSTARRRRKGYTLMVVAVDGGGEHALPADAVTRDEPAAGINGPYIPLAFRLHGDVFYVSGARWPELEGMALSLRAPGL